MATITPVLRPGSDSEKEGRLYLRISHQSVTRYVSLGRKARPSEWDDAQKRLSGTGPRARRENERIQRLAREARGAVEQVLPAQVPELKAAVKRVVEGRSPDSFSDWCRTEIEGMREAGRTSSADAYAVALRRLEGYLTGEADVRFRDLSSTRLREFKSALEGEGLSTNTISSYIGRLQSLWARARRASKTERAPFEGLSLPTERKGADPLTEAEVEALKEAPFEGELRRAKDWFLFSMFAGGMRFSDLATLRPESIGDSHLQYTMRKNGKEASVPILGPMREVLSRYEPTEEGWRFPVLEVRASADRGEVTADIRRAIASHNNRLRRIAERLGLGRDLTSHHARHTFAHLADQSGQRLRWIQQALRHSTPETTESYLRSLRQDELDEGIGETFEGLT